MQVPVSWESPALPTPTLPIPIYSQIAVKSVQFLNTDVWSKELLWALSKPDRTHYEQPPEKVGHTLPPQERLLLPVPRVHTWSKAWGPRKKLMHLKETEGRGPGSRIEAAP